MITILEAVSLSIGYLNRGSHSEKRENKHALRKFKDTQNRGQVGE